MIPYSFDYSICPYYLTFTIGCYQIVIRADNTLYTKCGSLPIETEDVDSIKIILISPVNYYLCKITIFIVSNFLRPVKPCWVKKQSSKILMPQEIIPETGNCCMIIYVRRRLKQFWFADRYNTDLSYCTLFDVIANSMLSTKLNNNVSLPIIKSLVIFICWNFLAIICSSKDDTVGKWYSV